MHPDSEISESLLTRSIDWNLVLDEAKKQSLLGIAFVGFKVWSSSDYVKNSSTNIDKRLLTQWVGVCEKIREDNLLLNKRTSQVCKNFAKDGFRTSVMKGQGNALLYGEQLSLMRSPGDIDVWVEGGFQKVYDYVKKIAPTSKVDQMEIIFDVFSDAKVEVHYRPIILRHPIRNKRLQKFLSSKAEECYNNRVKLVTLNDLGEEVWKDAVITTSSFNLVHQLAHIHLHLFTEGVGLRQVIDYYYQLIHAEKVLSLAEKEDVVNIIQFVKLDTLAKALTWILSTCFGLPKECQLWDPDEKDGKFLLEEILQTGNFGHNDDRRPESLHAGGISFFLYVQKHNLRLSRFDRNDWFWGSLWRIYYFFWRNLKGFSRI